MGEPFESSHVNIRTSLAERLPNVWVDAERIQQVFVNLLHNAVDAMQMGGDIALSSSVRMAGGNDRFVQVRVADTGKGVPFEIRDKIFDPFFTTKVPGKGTGLGLSVCHEILCEHGGSLTLESSGPQGSVFLMELPARLGMDVPAAADDHRAHPIAS